MIRAVVVARFASAGDDGGGRLVARPPVQPTLSHRSLKILNGVRHFIRKRIFIFDSLMIFGYLKSLLRVQVP